MVAFRKRSKSLDWAAVASSRDVAEVLRDPADLGLRAIQKNLDNITFGKVSKPPDEAALIKGFQYAQLTVEYLLHVQESLTTALGNAQAELAAERGAADDLRRKVSRHRHAPRQLRDCQATLQAASAMLAQFGVDTTSLQRMYDSSSSSSSSRPPEYVWVPAFLDPYDGKAFKSAEHLRRHMVARHSDELASDLASGSVGFSASSQAHGHTFAASAGRHLGSPGGRASFGATGSGGGGGSGCEAGPGPVPAPRDAVEAAAQRLVADVAGDAGRTVSRKALLKELQYLGTHPADCAAYGFLPPPPSTASATEAEGQPPVTVHDLLASGGCVDASSEANAALQCDWRVVDAQLRCFAEIDSFLRTDLQRRMAARVAATAAEVAAGFEMKQVENLDETALLLFRELDEDGSGEITLQELMAAVKDPRRGAGVRAKLGFGEGGQLSREDEARSLAFIEGKMEELDTDGDGLVSLPELKSFLERVAFFNNGLALGKELGFGGGLAAGEAIAVAERQRAADLASQLATRRAAEAALEASHLSLDSPRKATKAVACPEAIRLFTRLDRDGDGGVTLAEFVAGVVGGDKTTRAALGLAVDEDLGAGAEVAFKAFAVLDVDGSGTLGFDELSGFVDRFRAFNMGYAAGAKDAEGGVAGGRSAGAAFFDEADAARRLLEVEKQELAEALAAAKGEARAAAAALHIAGAGAAAVDGGVTVGAEAVMAAAMEELPEPPPGAGLWFELTVVSASNLRPADRNGLADPLAVVKANGVEVFRTGAVSKTLHPRWPVGGTANVAVLEGLNLGSHSGDVEVVVELWDQDGLVFKKAADFLGRAVLTKRDLLDPRRLGQGPVRIALEPGVGSGQGAELNITGSVELSWEAKARVVVGLHSASGLRLVARGGAFGLGKQAAASPSAKVRLSCPGCEVLNSKSDARRAVSASVYESATAPPSSAPAWGKGGGESKRVVVPLGKALDGACFEVVDGPSGAVLGVAHLSPEDLLTPTTAPAATGEAAEAASPRGSGGGGGGKGGAGVRTLNLMAPRDEAPSGAGVQARASGQLTVSVEGPLGLAAFFAACRRNADEAASHAAPPLECMEVEVVCLRASGLAAAKEPFVKVLLDGVAVGKRSRAVPTTRQPAWSSKDGNAFIVSVPFPRELAALGASASGHRAAAGATPCEAPATVLTVQLWDENKIARNELLGQVDLAWDVLVHPSLKAWPLADPGGGVGNGRSSGGSGAAARAQGTLTLRVRQLQMFTVQVLGAHGVAAADAGRSSDPYAEVRLLPGAGTDGGGDGALAAASAGLKLRTATVAATLSPRFFHHFVFSRALDPGDKAVDKAERKRRRDACAALLPPQPTGSGLREGPALPRFGGLWAEVAGGATPGTTFAPFAVRGDRLRPVPGDAPLGSTHVAAGGGGVGGVSGGDPGGGGGRRRACARPLAVEVALWDKDALSASDFLGCAVLDEAALRSPRLGVISLRLADDPSRNAAKLAISGWVEVLVRASVGPEVTESPRFRRAFPPPPPYRAPELRVRLTRLGASGLNAADANGLSDAFARLTGFGLLVADAQDAAKAGSGSGARLLADGVPLGATEVVARSLSPAWAADFEVTLPLDDATVTGDRDDDDDDDDDGGGGGGGGGDSGGGGNAANSAVELRVFDKDTFGADDFLGFARLGFADLCGLSAGDEAPPHPAPASAALPASPSSPNSPPSTAAALVPFVPGRQSCRKALGPSPEEAEAAAKQRGGKGGALVRPKRSFEFFACKYVDILPPAGSLRVACRPSVTLELTLVGAAGLAGANFDGLSDPYAKVRVLGQAGPPPPGNSGAGGGGEAAECLVTPGRVGKDGYLRGAHGKRPFRTAVVAGSLAPVWYETVAVALDLFTLFGHDKAGAGAGLSVEVWDEPSVAGHRFLGRVLLSREHLASLALAPPVAPLQWPLDGGGPEVPPGKRLKAPVTGFLELHVAASALPKALRAAIAPHPRAEEKARGGGPASDRRRHQPQPPGPWSTAPRPSQDMWEVPEGARAGGFGGGHGAHHGGGHHGSGEAPSFGGTARSGTLRALDGHAVHQSGHQSGRGHGEHGPHRRLGAGPQRETPAGGRWDKPVSTRHVGADGGVGGDGRDGGVGGNGDAALIAAEQMRAELLIRETARQNIEARMRLSRSGGAQGGLAEDDGSPRVGGGLEADNTLPGSGLPIGSPDRSP